ncbi:transposase [Tateyamaria sp.]|uniref:transposase n=1 Tax=Tateyamaria sp. TaxID=1929288 RepID=UPI00329F1E58
MPRQNSTGGKDRLGRTTKMGQRDIRRFLMTGAMSVTSASERKGRCDDPWLANMLKKKSRMLVAVALENRMARQLWATMVTEENYESHAAV